MNADERGCLVRCGTPADLAAVRHLLNEAPEAAQWVPDSYDFFVAEVEGHIAGFLVWHRTASDEVEVLNLAVRLAHRRRGIAKALLGGLPKVSVFLEVRESNLAAVGLYQAVGFSEVGRRRGYYQNPSEGAIVMRLQS